MPKSSRPVELPRPAERPDFGGSRGAIWLAALCLVGAILAAYHNSFAGPFVFDDGPAILGNPSIRHLSALSEVFSPPLERGQTVGGRPLVNFSLAVNYALGGENVRGYHVFNFVVHTLGALTLFGIARRTFLQPIRRDRFGSAATPLALTLALLWAVHPLLTESVTYVIQRAESLMGLFYLLTLYCFIRGAQTTSATPGNRGAGRWYLSAVLSCFLGMATKEVMVSAPLLVLLYDRTFVTGSWRETWAKRKIFYASLALTWLPLAWLVAGAEHRGGTAGLGMGDSVWTYALTQTRAILTYLRLALWPQPLVFDYGTDTITRLADAVPFVLALGALLVAAIFALRRWQAAGFLGAWFFLILAPSSSLVPIPVQPMAEHRMYLPLVAVVALVVVGLYARWKKGCWFIFGAAAVALGALTVVRNEAYREPGSIWADTLKKRPANARAHCYAGDVLAGQGQFTEALAHYEEAIRLDRSAINRGDRSIYGDILVNSGNVLRALNRPAEATARYEEALRVDPDLAAAHFNLGGVHLQANRFPEAIDQFERALKIDANYPAAHTSLGSALLLAGKPDDALRHFETALRLNPSAKAHRDLGMAWLYLRKAPEATAELLEAIRLDPTFAQPHEFLGSLFASQGHTADAAEHYRRVLQLEPGNERAKRALEALTPASR